MKTLFRLGLAVAILTASAPFASVAAASGKPFNLVLPFPPGGSVDAVARMIAPLMAESLGQPVVVENKSGAGGNLAASHVARAPKDGHTILMNYSMFHVGNPSLYPNIDWHPTRDFVAISQLAVVPHVIAVHPAVAATTLQEYVALARAQPGSLHYASAGNGSASHVGMELFAQKTGVELTHVPYRGGGPAMLDLVSGAVQSTLATPPTIMGFVQQGKLRPLAVAAQQRVEALPDVPTTAEAGFPGFELEAWITLFAPAGTPDATVQRLADAAKAAMESPSVQERARAIGVQIRYMGPAMTDRFVAQELAHWSAVIQKAAINMQ